MANCHDLFQDFHLEIRILSSKRKRMMKSKDTLRDKIREHFREHHPGYDPVFFIQGSDKLKNGIRNSDDTCDLDDGVYFEREPDVSSTTLQQWVYNAVKDHTDGGQEHRKKCIRVIYAGDYHIDLPVYYKRDTDLHPFLAIKSNGWEESDPKEFVDWFNNRKDSEGLLLRIIKYLKAWCDNVSKKMPSGLCMTVLAEKNIGRNQRDDIALKDTLSKIKMDVDWKWECVMPTTPNDDLFKKYIQTVEETFKKEIKEFVEDAEKAVNTEDKEEASKLWRKHLGDRFPLFENVEEQETRAASLAGIGFVNRPWANEG